MSTNDTNGVQVDAAVEATSATKSPSFFARIPKPVKIGVAAGLAIALVAGGTAATFVAVNASQEQAAKDRYTTAVADLQEAIAADAAATNELNATFVAVTVSQVEGAALAASLVGLVDQAKLDELNTAITDASEAIEQAVADASVDPALQPFVAVSTSSVKVDKSSTIGFTIDEFDKRTVVATKGASDELKSVKTQVAITESLDDAIVAVDEAVLDLPVGLADLATATVAAHPSAGQPEKDAVIAAATAVAKAATPKDAAAADVVASLKAYVTAVDKLKASHAAAEAAEAAEAARLADEQANAETYTDPSTGQTVRDPR